MFKKVTPLSVILTFCLLLYSASVGNAETEQYPDRATDTITNRQILEKLNLIEQTLLDREPQTAPEKFARGINKPLLNPRGHGVFELGIRYYTGDWYYELDGGMTKDYYDFTERRLTLNIEYSLLKNLGFRLTLPYLSRDMNTVGVVFLDTSYTTYIVEAHDDWEAEGFGDIEAGLRYRLPAWIPSWLVEELVIDLWTRQPTGDDSLSTGKINLGTGQMDVWGGLIARFMLPYDFSIKPSAYYRWREQRKTGVTTLLINGQELNCADEYHIDADIDYQASDLITIGARFNYFHELEANTTSLLEAGGRLLLDAGPAYAEIAYTLPVYGKQFPANPVELELRLSNDPVLLGPRSFATIGIRF
jgi:hypothetical protein